MNTYKATISFEIDIPVGYEFERFGKPRKGEALLNDSEEIEIASHDFNYGRHIILRKIWKPPEYLRESKCKCVQRKCGDWLGCDNYGCALLNITYSGLPFTPPCGPEVPDEQTVRRW